ncbi:MAG: nucleotide sugar dehydrogenase [Patescibacteria group bacterium]|jgi:nucleotide sugar dehydrogenase
MVKKIKKAEKLKSQGKKQKKRVVTIVGVGYVGLPLACLCGDKGFTTFGISRDSANVKMINKGTSPIKGDPELAAWVAKKNFVATTKFDSVKKSDIIVICVPTPVDKMYNPDLTPVRSACNKIAPLLHHGQLVVMESTVNPGVCEEVIKPILEKGSKLIAGKDFYLAHSPERINPGDPKWNVTNIPRCVGATNKKGLSLAVNFYRKILSAPIRPMKSIKEAEATKIIENSFRDINIAFVNELARSFEALGIDLVDVIEGAKTKPFAFMAHYPSCGVGGHCIPVDPYYLIERARLAGFDHRFLKLARQINNSMPKYTVDLLNKGLNQIKKSLKGTKVGILGISYKANVGDKRESPALKIIEILREEGAELNIFDPFFNKESTVKSLDELLKKSEAIIIATDHEDFKKIPVNQLKRNGIKVVVDGKNCLSKEEVIKNKIIYKGIGR